MIEKLFANLTKWRDLPSYQLERRVDIFFSIYFQEILSEKIGNDEWFIIPEFPIPIKEIDSNIKHNKSYKIDYLVVGKKINKVLFLELKTDNFSRREKQDQYLLEAKRIGLIKLMEGLKDIFLATKSKKKYYHLFTMLKEIGFVKYDISLETKIKNSLPKIRDGIKKIEVIDCPITRTLPEIIYIQPTGSGSNIISFDYISDVISNRYDDEISTTFSKTLKFWSSKKAGEF